MQIYYFILRCGEFHTFIRGKNSTQFYILLDFSIFIVFFLVFSITTIRERYKIGKVCPFINIAREDAEFWNLKFSYLIYLCSTLYVH